MGGTDRSQPLRRRKLAAWPRRWIRMRRRSMGSFRGTDSKLPRCCSGGSRSGGGPTGKMRTVPYGGRRSLADLAVLAGVLEGVVLDTVRPFQERGLLVVRKTDRGEVVDLPHECLCLKWDRLKGWIRSEAEDAKKLRFLLDSVGKNYLAGLALSEALQWQRGG